MNHDTRNRSLAFFVVGGIVGMLLHVLLSDGGSSGPVVYAQANAENGLSLTSLQQEVEILKGKAPSQAHAMMDVDYHYTNLWFAAKAENWPLAEFYWNETLSHMRWAVRIIPVRKDDAGQPIKLQDILESIEQSPFAQIGKSIEENDVKKFESAYRSTMEGCYACHKASGKPYLRPQMPVGPATTIVNFDPTADWPK